MGHQGLLGVTWGKPGETRGDRLALLGPTWPSLILGNDRKAFFILAKTKTGQNSYFSLCPKPIPKQNKTFCFGQNRYRN